MMRWNMMIAVCVAMLVLSACSNTPPTAGTATSFSAVCVKANDGKRVAVDGYPRFPDSFTDDGSVILRLYETDAFKGDIIGVQTNFGTQPNQVAKVANQFTDNDLQIYLANGQTVRYGTKVHVSGTVYFPIVAQEFPCSLSNPLIETIQ